MYLKLFDLQYLKPVEIDPGGTSRKIIFGIPCITSC